MGNAKGPAEGHQRLFSAADERRLSDNQEMRTPDSRDLLLVVAMLLALLSGWIAVHEIVYSPPMLSAAEAGLIVSSSTLTLVSTAVAYELWTRDRDAADPAGTWAETS